MEEMKPAEAQAIQDEKLVDAAGGTRVLAIGPIICELGVADEGEGAVHPNASHIPAANVLS